MIASMDFSGRKGLDHRQAPTCTAEAHQGGDEAHGEPFSKHRHAEFERTLTTAKSDATRKDHYSGLIVIQSS